MISLLPDRFYDLIILSIEWNRSVNYAPTCFSFIAVGTYWYLFNVVNFFFHNLYENKVVNKVIFEKKINPNTKMYDYNIRS